MNDLLDQTISAHGGIERWSELTNIHTRLSATGAVWDLKGQPKLFADAEVDVDPRRQFVQTTPFIHGGWKGIFEPDHVRIVDADGRIQEERTQPRESFAGHTLQTQWDHLHAIYFGGYALWTYLTLPFVLTRPGFVVDEIAPWQDEDQELRRLRVQFPADIATHSTEQVLYLNEAGLIVRHDYTAAITGGGAGAHFLSGHKTFDGIVFPTRRRVFPRQPDNSAAPQPLLIDIDFDGYALS
ncbi:hypothetical protein [Streptomyces mirabilis]|uniref:hypothetical protein n=1 Tax=Streptomyces mirabilis TaxID=68239 RepID=UPI0036BA1065